MRHAVIVEAVRTPTGRRDGQLKDLHAVDLAAEALRAVVARSGVDAEAIDDVIMGCVSQVGEQAGNIARNAILTAGLPESVCGTTVDRACGSSQQAMHFAAQGVMAGAYDVVIAAGVESMSRVPMGASMSSNGVPFTAGMAERYADRGGMVMQGISAELIADHWNLSREELDAFGARSQQRAEAATAEGRFDREILPVVIETDGVKHELRTDEGIRAGTTAEKLAGLNPSFKPDGKITAGTSSQISDGSAAMLIMSEEAAARHGLTPRARFHTFALAGVDPIFMLTGPIPATAKALERSGLGIGDIDRFEINEAFASVVLAWQRETGADLDRVNVNGGAIALGHPLGCSGVKLMTTLLHELERTGGRYGLQSMCEGGGMANATIIERLG